MKPLQELERHGYIFDLNGPQVHYKYNGPGKPDPIIVNPLLAELKSRKAEVVRILLQRSRQVTCYACRGIDFWHSVHGQWICRVCHPPTLGAEKVGEVGEM